VNNTGGIALDYLLEDRGWKFFSSPPLPERLWVTPSLLCNVYQGSFPVSKAAGPWSWPLTSI